MGLASALSFPETDSVWSEALIAVGLDLGSKFLIAAIIPSHGKLSFFTNPKGVGWLIIRHEENCAGGGGLFRWPFIVYLAILFMSISIAGQGRPGGGYLVGGVVGNITSFFIGTGGTVASSLPAFFLLPPTGCVVDFIQIGAPIFGDAVGTGAPVCNVADLFVIAGSMMLSIPFFGEHKILALLASPFAITLLGLTLHLIRRIFTGA